MVRGPKSTPDSRLDSPGTTDSEADPKYFQYLSSYAMNGCLSNANYDNGGTPSNHHPLHKINEFQASQALVFRDYPMTGALGDNGQFYPATKADPSVTPVDQPSVSARHSSLKKGNIVTNDPTFIRTMQGGIPVSFLDGHAELWPIYVFYDNLNEPGRDMGPSAIWICPTQADGGNQITTRSMTDIMGSD